MHDLVLTVIAEDKPGLVERIAQCISSHDGNWLESRMARMAGQFAGILRVQVAQAKQSQLLAALTALQEQGLRIQLAPAGTAPVSACRSIRLELVGNDRPGIVRDITRLLSSQGVNLESLTTEVIPAPMSGELLFQAQALLAVPESLALEQLQSHLETLADDLMVELKLQVDD
ncbi:glycine cleavage system protein R [Pseudomonas sp. 5P_3.1_Bac2]|uniref:glycine cleavage system protein R n=1 Tax=Pseudomonas sp. 5P_3.1_Bac2 TaxID=2971617 RepID=UPI0021C623BB|nr:ACT domain-containing protein [Pseudomonas sp. 5P_3.1_Bac2]MCU1717779.1 glycine cleavage system protein R [Pseudomonas sp. 5P_3.1_Bac2]